MSNKQSKPLLSAAGVVSAGSSGAFTTMVLRRENRQSPITLGLGFPRPQTGARIPISWKKRFGLQKCPHPLALAKAGKREFAVQKSQFSMCSLLEIRGFFDRKLPFPERGEMGVLGPRNPLFQKMGKENLLENFSGRKEKLSRPVVDTKPYKNQENHIHHRNFSFVDPIFSAKKSSALEQGGVCFFFSQKEIPWCFECFSLFFQGFCGFPREQNILGVLGGFCYAVADQQSFPQRHSLQTSCKTTRLGCVGLSSLVDQQC